LLYVLAFHYGRPAARRALSLAGHLRTAINRIQCLPKTMRQLLPRLLYGLAASSTLAALNIYHALHFDALEDDWVMHQQATLPHRTWVCFCFLATVVSSLPSFFHWLGSSTLGSYVAHSYINLIFTVTLLDNPSVTFSTPS
jgi:hypothetical protein